MGIRRIKLIYFSPTGTTRKILEGIAQGFGAANVEQVDLTLPVRARQPVPVLIDELAILGAPVYGGRLPVDAIKRFNQVQGENGLAVLVVMYGNREFDDALLELKNLARELGFHPIAGGAFIGEHSFASAGIPVANGRPDSLDMKKAEEFGRRIKAKVIAVQSTDTLIDVDVPGSYPYEAVGARAMAVSPVTRQDACRVCGTCADVCPTAVISIDGGVTTDAEHCIRCCACIKSCPEEARVMENETWKQITTWLSENCGSRMEPQLFGVDR